MSLSNPEINKIHLLPDALANKIAAGEVVQRPSSVVKELVENAMDAGGTEVSILVEEAGKTLVQVLDNGSGMSEQDARMAFERHATSKIKTAQDLEAIHTMGFRGEALASIASVSKLEMKTRMKENDVGTSIQIQGSKVHKVEPCACPVGTSIAVRHLFYNVPARRKFLKKDATELKAITTEFIRAALSRPGIKFHFYRDGTEVFHLQSGSLRQRIAALFDKKTNHHLIPIEQDLDWVKLSGFVGRPEIHKKTRGDQYLFVNNRYIQSPYLMHGIRNVYNELIPEGSHPFVVLFLEMDPTRVDVNVHPTKHEVKFEDERVLYNMIKVAVRHSLGQYALHPMIDFETPPQRIFEQPAPKPNLEEVKGWKKLYEETSPTLEHTPSIESIRIQSSMNPEAPLLSQKKARAFQLHKKYVIQQVKSGILLIHQHRAHERILYEKNLELLKNGVVYSQKELFPKVVHISKKQKALYDTFAAEAQCLGFEIAPFGDDAVIIHGTPAHLSAVPKESDALFEELLEEFTENIELNLSVKENVAQSLAAKCAVKTGTVLDEEQMNELIDSLFACANPYTNPRGKKCFIILEHGDLDNMFLR